MTLALLCLAAVALVLSPIALFAIETRACYEPEPPEPVSYSIPPRAVFAPEAIEELQP